MPLIQLVKDPTPLLPTFAGRRETCYTWRHVTAPVRGAAFSRRTPTGQQNCTRRNREGCLSHASLNYPERERETESAALSPFSLSREKKRRFENVHRWFRRGDKTPSETFFPIGRRVFTETISGWCRLGCR